MAGKASGSSTAGKSGSGASAGHPAAGSATTGDAGSATSEGGAGEAGEESGGSAGAAGNASTAGRAGTAGSGGRAGNGGTTSGGGTGGSGGAGNKETLLFDFETDISGWEANSVVLSVDPAQFVTGAKSLKAVVPALAIGTSVTLGVSKVELWPGAKVVMHVWSPAGTDGLLVQAFTQSNNWKKWDIAGNGATTLVRGGWTTLTYAVPKTFPGGLQQFGVQIAPSTDAAFAGGTFYIDSVVVSGGAVSCAGNGTGAYGFEGAADVESWGINESPPTPDTVISQSTTQPKTGTKSLKVAFTAVPAGTPSSGTARFVFMYGPSAYCSDEVTFNIWTPEGSDALTFQPFAQFNNYDGWAVGGFPADITRGGWTELKFTLPPEIGAGGLQRVGLQFFNTGDVFTGDVYIDDVTW